MTLGTNRIYQLTPTDAAGRWGHPTTQVFGCTVYDLGGGAFTLRSVAVERTSALGVVTNQTVHSGAAFQAPWNDPASTWNAGTGVLTMYQGGFAAGEQLRFTVCTRDGAGNDTYSTWYVGIGAAPGTADPPTIGARARVNGKHFRITAITGAAGAQRYTLEPTDHTMAGVMLLRRNDFEYVSPRGILDARILLSE